MIERVEVVDLPADRFKTAFQIFLRFFVLEFNETRENNQALGRLIHNLMVSQHMAL